MTHLDELNQDLDLLNGTLSDLKGRRKKLRSEIAEMTLQQRGVRPGTLVFRIREPEYAATGPGFTISLVRLKDHFQVVQGEWKRGEIHLLVIEADEDGSIPKDALTYRIPLSDLEKA